MAAPGGRPRPGAEGLLHLADTPDADPGPVSPGSKHKKHPTNTEQRLQEDEIGVDWLSITAEGDSWLDEVRTILESMEGEGQPARTFQGYRYGLVWASGARLLWGHASGRAWLQLDGSACAGMGGAAVHQLGQRAMLGGTCKRIDLRRDLKGKGLTLVDDIVQACDLGQLCHVRQWCPFPIKSSTGELLGNGVRLGSYGSTRLIRCYDKGLETGENLAGEWVRFEAQLRDEPANEAAVAVFTAGDSWPRVAFQHAAGVADFRVGRKPGRALDEFPRPSFWRRFLAGVETVRPQLLPHDADPERWTEALRTQYGGVLRLAALRSGVTLEAAAVALLAHAPITEGTRKNPVVDKLAALLREISLD